MFFGAPRCSYVSGTGAWGLQSWEVGAWSLGRDWMSSPEGTGKRIEVLSLQGDDHGSRSFIPEI